jgi:hypothetical protein
MSAQPVHDAEDPRDPLVILSRLPEDARPAFLTEYRAAVDTARDPVGYRALRDLLQSWSVLAVAYAKPDFAQRYSEVRDGTGDYVTLEEVVARRHER